MLELANKIIIVLTLFLGIFACGVSTKEQIKIEDPKEYVGWWVYGEGQHIFKNEENLGGAGYIGSHTIVELLAGFTLW